MSQKEKKSGEVSRRDFLKGAGLVVGGATMGTVFLSACAPAETETVTTTTTAPPVTTTVTVTPPAVEGVTTLNVNGEEHVLKVKPNWTLAFVLREKLGLVGTKVGCDRGSCGTCTVIVDGRPVYSCMMLAQEAEGTEVTTVEGISDGITLHPVQQAFYDNDAIQCGFCTPGFVMAAKALLDKTPSPTSDEVREALSGHICICGTTKRMVEALL